MLTEPGVVLGPAVILRFVDEEFDEFGIGEAGRDVPALLEGARLGEDIVGARLEFVREGVRLGVGAEGVRLGVLTIGDRLGAAGLRVLRLDDALELARPEGREVDLESLGVETGEALDEAVAPGVGVALADETSTICL